MTKQTHYQCLSCHSLWKQKPGPTECPACMAIYVKELQEEEVTQYLSNTEANFGVYIA